MALRIALLLAIPVAVAAQGATYEEDEAGLLQKTSVESWKVAKANLSVANSTVVEERCTQLYGTYCLGHSMECHCNYCDDFCEDTPCKRTCRVLNGHESSLGLLHGHACEWFATWVQYPEPGWHGEDCSWMVGDGHFGKGDDCRRCDQNAIDCRITNPEVNCWAHQ